MKKVLSLALVLVLMMTMFVGCGSTDAETSATPATTATPEVSLAPIDVNIMAISGPTGMGLVQFMSEIDGGNVTSNNYSIELLSSAETIPSSLVKGTVDIVCLPANTGSTLYNNLDGGVTALAINTLGILYILEDGETVNSVEDLKGKTIYAAGQGGTPEYALRYILTQNGIDPDKDVTIEWKSEQAEVLATVNATSGAIAMLPQPFATNAMAANSGLNVRLDLTEEWDAIQDGSDTASALCTGVTLVRTEFLEAYPEVVEEFMAYYAESVNYINENVTEGAELCYSYGIAGIASVAVAEKAIPACNLVCISGEEMKEILSGYLAVLFESAPTSVGNAIPGDDFYYGA